MEQIAISPTFYPLVAACKAHGIARNTAYKLANSGQIETFFLGTKRFVRLESLAKLGLRKSKP